MKHLFGGDFYQLVDELGAGVFGVFLKHSFNCANHFIACQEIFIIRNFAFYAKIISNKILQNSHIV